MWCSSRVTAEAQIDATTYWCNQSSVKKSIRESIDPWIIIVAYISTSYAVNVIAGANPTHAENRVSDASVEIGSTTRGDEASTLRSKKG